MKSRQLLLISLILIILSAPETIAQDFSKKDFLISAAGDTIFGKVTLKNNCMAVVENKKGKFKFRADKAILFQRGATRYVSIDTKFPEYLKEVVSGKYSYYTESYLKEKSTVDYTPHNYIVFEDKVFPIDLPALKTNLYIEPEESKDNPGSFTTRKISGEIEFQYALLQRDLEKLLDENNPLYKLIENRNLTFNDLPLIVQLMNDPLPIADMQTGLESNFAKGYIITKSNDTIRGYIHNKTSLNDGIQFKEADGTRTRIEPSNIEAFRINDRIYKSIGMNDKSHSKILFLEELQHGDISLFVAYESPDIFQKDFLPPAEPTIFPDNLNVKAKYYLQKEEEALIPVKRDNTFIECFRDKPEVYKRIIENEYNRYEIESIVILYNHEKK